MATNNWLALCCVIGGCGTTACCDGIPTAFATVVDGIERPGGPRPRSTPVRANLQPCHGKNAVGENPATPMGGWKDGVGQLAPALNGRGHAWHHPPSYHLQIIRKGSTLQGSRMIGWDTRLSDFDIIAVIAYFQSLWPPHLKAAYQRQYLYRVGE